jgi:hypothetical protein
MGRTPVTAPRLIKACSPNHPVIPAARNRPNVSGARRAMRTPAHNRAPRRPSTRISPIRPSSSPRMAKMKSVWALGTYIHFCRLAPSPTPAQCPDPRAYSDWMICQPPFFGSPHG